MNKQHKTNRRYKITIDKKVINNNLTIINVYNKSDDEKSDKIFTKRNMLLVAMSVLSTLGSVVAYRWNLVDLLAGYIPTLAEPMDWFNNVRH